MADLILLSLDREIENCILRIFKRKISLSILVSNDSDSLKLLLFFHDYSVLKKH